MDDLGVRMYLRYADDLHRPRVWIKESGSPTCAAAVAAPIRKLCPYPETVTPRKMHVSHVVARSECCQVLHTALLSTTLKRPLY